MFYDVNSAFFVGVVVGDVNFRTVGRDNISLAKFTLALNEKIKDQDDKGHFFDFTAWRGTADFCEKHLFKGLKVAVEAEVRQERWKNEMGENRSKIGFLVRKIQPFSWDKSDKSEVDY